jgi:UDP-N-acetylmuramate: L-alanyl-gamma-D-glutamyl-meso-diaminopimelate ligase
MHNLAIALHIKGYRISGSDDSIFEPSKSRLIHYGLFPKEIGWNSSNISDDLDYVILGMHAKKDNPELIEAQKKIN